MTTRNSILSAAFLVWLLPAAWGCGGGGGDEAETTADRGDAIDPLPYRMQVEAVENLLYRQGPAELEDFSRVSRALTALGTRVLNDPSNLLNLSAGQQLLGLGAEVGAMGDVGYAMPDLVSLRRQWEEARDELFQPVDWFQAGGVELDAAQTPEMPDVEYGDVHSLKYAMDKLESLISRGRGECEDLGEPVYSDPAHMDTAGERQVQRWNEFARRWPERIRDCLDDLPPRPGFDEDMHWVMAFQHLDQAAVTLQMVPHGAGMWPTPFKAAWEQQFDLAGRKVDEARYELEQLEK